ncbi:MAG: HAMP domain-containing histidine kinase [Proteobacteria bacterium]|nr:HAMP domain-containing histidine kinase [Pseudomonadota bacterium]
MSAENSPVSPLSEEDWIDGELIRSLMRSAPQLQVIALLLVPLAVAMMVGSVPGAPLAVWSAAVLLVSGARLWLMRRYAKELAHADAAAQRRFMARYGFTWPLSACIWGLMTLLCFDRTPQVTQFLCWLMIVGLGSFTANSFSNHLQTMHAYANALALTVLASVAWRIGWDLHFQAPRSHYWILLLVVFYWVLLRQTGRKLHESHHGYVELQYRNARLIESLTRQTEAALDAVAIKNRFLANAAHDLRQPVHALGLYADWLATDPAMAPEIVPRIVQSTRAVNALFDSLFDLEQFNSGRKKVRIEPIDLACLFTEMELQYRPLARARGLALRLHGATGHVLSDRIVLQRILGNLIGNALKYTHRGGVLLAARRSAGAIRIEVWDTGIGIASSHHADIFQEFYKVPERQGTDDGFGLGLAIVARLAGRLGHQVTMNSRPGRGSVFRLTLERCAPPEQGAALAPEQAVGAGEVHGLGPALHAQAPEQSP